VESRALTCSAPAKAALAVAHPSIVHNVVVAQDLAFAWSATAADDLACLGFIAVSKPARQSLKGWQIAPRQGCGR
jgi:hypothetical protein